MGQVAETLMFWRPRLTRERAIEIARSECEVRGLPCREPLKAYRHLTHYSVWTMADSVGGNVIIEVDHRTGEVRSVRGPTPR